MPELMFIAPAPLGTMKYGATLHRMCCINCKYGLSCVLATNIPKF